MKFINVNRVSGAELVVIRREMPPKKLSRTMRTLIGRSKNGPRYHLQIVPESSLRRTVTAD